jgi:hypothetical protein
VNPENEQPVRPEQQETLRKGKHRRRRPNNKTSS